MPLADAIWRLHLPSGYEAVRAGGTMTPEDLPHPPLAAAEVVGWLAGVNDALESHLSLSGAYSARESARRVASSNNLKQIALATVNVEETHLRQERGIVARRTPHCGDGSDRPGNSHQATRTAEPGN